MGILQFGVDHVNQLAAAPIGRLTLDFITSTYPHLFEGLGELRPPLSLTLNPDVKPNENEPTPWVSNMVVRERPATDTKQAKVRICLDPCQTVNKAILRPMYPIPTLEENLHHLHQADSFSTFDIRDAFQTIKLTEKSSKLTTMHIP